MFVVLREEKIRLLGLKPEKTNDGPFGKTLILFSRVYLLFFLFCFFIIILISSAKLQRMDRTQLKKTLLMLVIQRRPRFLFWSLLTLSCALNVLFHQSVCLQNFLQEMMHLEFTSDVIVAAEQRPRQYQIGHIMEFLKEKARY